MKTKVISLVMVLLLLFPSVSYASSVQDEEKTVSEAIITDENGNQLTLPVTVSEPVREISNTSLMMDDPGSENIESYHQDFSVSLDKETVDEAITRAGGSYSDFKYDGSYTLKLWGRVYFDKKMALDINGDVQDTYCVTQMEGHFKNAQPDRVSVLSRHVVASCTNNFNSSTAQRVHWWPSIPTFNNKTNFKYYAFANQPFAAIGGSMTCDARTSSGQSFELTLSLPIAGTNVVPGL